MNTAIIHSYSTAAILDSKIVRNKLYYLVDWLGYSPNERTWELVENVINARALLEDFHRQCCMLGWTSRNTGVYSTLLQKGG